MLTGTPLVTLRLLPRVEGGDAPPRVMSVVTAAELFSESMCPVLHCGGESVLTHTERFVRRASTDLW